MVISSAVIDGSFVVHWIITTVLMLGVIFGIRHAVGSISRER
jgi:hypothetical protein